MTQHQLQHGFIRIKTVIFLNLLANNWQITKHNTLPMITIKLTLDTRSQKNDGTFPIKLYASYKKDFVRIGTGYNAKQEHWSNTEYFNRKEPNFQIKNMKLRNMLSEIEKQVFLIEQPNIQKIKETIHNALKGRGQTKKTFLNYMDDFIGLKTNKGTANIYRTTRDKIAEFDSQATFETMTIDWLKRFEAWLEHKGCRTNYRSIQLRNIRAVFNYAIDNEWTTLYPFRRFKIKTQETAKRSLSIEQLRTLRDYPVQPYQEKYRDIFMLMFYLIGINSADLFTLPPLQGEYITYHRAKTGKLYKIKVEPEARDIINRYQGKKFMLDVGDEYKNYKDFTHWMNIGLKKIGQMERIGKGGKKIIQPLFPSLSAYWARHTWATIAASLDIPKETIAAALGHSSNTVTDIYIRFDNRKIDEANRKVIDYVNNLRNTQNI